MSDGSVIPFEFDGQKVRVIEHPDGPLFVAKDVAAVLGYADTAHAIRRHCKAARRYGVGVSPTHPELDPQTLLIPERDVYRLIMRSKLPTAEMFEEWVVGDVLPTIRRTGSYGRPGAVTINIDDLKHLIREEIEAERLANPQNVAIGYISALEVAKRHKVPQKGRRGIVRSISAHLLRWCTKIGQHPRVSAESGKYLFPADAVNDWLLKGGFDVIRRHLSKLEGQGVFHLVNGGRKPA